MPIKILEHESRVLKGNPLGDPHRRELWVYLPPGAGKGERRYPVLWHLIGFTGAGQMAVTGNRWAPGLAERLDRLIAKGCPPVIVAFPDCFTRLGGSQYMNSDATGHYEDYLCDELVPFLDGSLPTLPHRDTRGVFGKSSGGYGALRLGMRRPDLFSAVACHSGDMAFALTYAPGFAKTVAEIAKAGSIEKWLAAFESREKKKGADFDAINTIAMASCYSPDAGEPLGIALPFDLESGEPDAAVWARWKEHDPVEMVYRHADALKRLKLLFLDCGSEDEYHLHLGMRLLAKRCKELGIACEVEEFPDDHRSVSYRYDVSIPKLASAITAETQKRREG
ncbi:MAG TPA: alpha/beta hydrolase-fold protein [Planctomycetota bacterium]|nr:alpha/beta hydrolase-fold protein [Planctomycetota bacterium]